ncbi:hypothetical protein C2E23DRAFT_75693 [Lenzites betulinus]|nr:hypothetical protein C2E23DRAFT_75693 [Lenzites betulinus]
MLISPVTNASKPQARGRCHREVLFPRKLSSTSQSRLRQETRLKAEKPNISPTTPHSHPQPYPGPDQLPHNPCASRPAQHANQSRL